jgi:Phage integrase family
MSELYDGLARYYRVNGRKSLDAVERRWLLHLKPVFGDMPARNLTHDLLNKYIDQRQAEKAANATINRELAALKTMLRLGLRDHKLTVPLFPRLEEDNVRTGFIEQSGFDKLRELAKELWLRLFLEMAFTYGWRKKQFLTLRVRQADVLTNSIRLDVGTTKNKDGLEVTMTQTIRELVKLAIVGKNPEDYLLTRANDKPVRDFRKTWHKLSVQAGLGRMVCRECENVVTGKKCQCGGKRLKYVGRIIHDFRRSAARELRRAGVPESTIMDIGGWKTRQMFKRYAITDTKDVADAIARREHAQTQNGHDFSHDLEFSGPSTIKDSRGITN